MTRDLLVAIGRALVTKALTALRAVALPPGLRTVAAGGGRSWFGFPIVREPYTGAWQNNDEIRADTVLGYAPVFACIDLIARDIGKLGLRLVEQNADGIWEPVEVAAFSPVLRKPNRYQNRITFVQQWLCSKLAHGNTYVLKQRDGRGAIAALYVLDPLRVTPLVAPDGSVYYQLNRDDLAGLPGTDPITVPASEIIHDLMIPLFHPLIGVSPIYACGMAALQGQAIVAQSRSFFANGSQPGGVLHAPGEISADTATRLSDYWNTHFTGDNAGKVAVLGDGLEYSPLAVNAHDAQLIEQLKWSAQQVCSCYHVPSYMIEAGPPPNYNNIEALNQAYYSQCLQSLIESFELCLDEGLELPKPYGTEFDLDDLLRMDTPTKTKAAADGVGSGCLSPNEARFRYFDLGPKTGGETPYMQQQMFALSALAERDAEKPFAKPAAPTPPPPAPPAEDDDDESADAFEAALTWRVIRAIEVDRAA